MVALAVLGGLLLAPGLAVGPSLDASIFSTVGWRLAEGDALYAEVWDHKPPGAYLPYVVAHLLTGAPSIAWAITWGMTLAGLVGASLVVAALLARCGVLPVARWAAAALCTFGGGAYLLSLGGGLSETLALLPLAGALAASVTGRWTIAGVFAGIAIAVSFQSGPVVGAIAVVGLARGRGSAIGRGARVVAGILAVAAVVALGLWVNGGLGSAADALLGYSAAYRAVTGRGGGASAWALLPWTVLVLLPLLVGCGVAMTERMRLADAKVAGACVAWIALGALLIGFQGRYYAHYATPLVVPLAVLTGLGIDALARGRGARVRLAGIGAIMAMAVTASFVIGSAGAAQEQAPIRASNQRVLQVASFLRSSTGPTSSIFVWGNDARVYELAGRRPASRYVYLYPLLTPGYATPERIEAVEIELTADIPAAFVDTGSLEPGAPGLPPLLIERPIATDGRDLDLLQPLRDLVGSDYALAGVENGWPVHVRGTR